MHPVLLIIIALFSTSCEPDSADTDISESETLYIPDENFKYALVHIIDIDINDDEEIQRNEAESIESLILHFDYEEISGYVDLTGIENFVNLKNLKITGEPASEMEGNVNSELINYDFTNLKKLEFLQLNHIGTNYFSSIDLSRLNNLTEANLSNNRPDYFGENIEDPINFVKVKMEGCSNLISFSLVNSFLKNNFCDIPSLETLNMSYLEGGEPDTFDFHCLANLEWLDISENYFESLILKNSSVLQTFKANDIGSTGENSNYPFLKYICIDDVQEEYDQISTLRDENTVVDTDCTF